MHLFLRSLGVVYCIAYVSWWVQIEELIGGYGILPYTDFFADISTLPQWLRKPSWLAWTHSNLALHISCFTGILCGLILIVRANAWAAGWAWFNYLSLTIAAQTFGYYQWDTLLSEVGFLAIFAACTSRRHASTVTLCLRVLLCRFHLSCGLVKLLSGDINWAQLTGLPLHYATQPLPHLGGWLAHDLPTWFHSMSVLMMLGIELILPIALFCGARARRISVVGIIALQCAIMATGNFGFFNLTTIALALSQWTPHTPHPLPRRALAPALLYVIVSMAQAHFVPSPQTPTVIMEARQRVAQWRIFNRYGVFASLATHRHEVLIQGSVDGQQWLTYALPYKPDHRFEAPRFAWMHMPRVDWQLWITGSRGGKRAQWLKGLFRGLQQERADVLALFDHNPFAAQPPAHLRALYVPAYFASDRSNGAYWEYQAPQTLLQAQYH